MSCTMWSTKTTPASGSFTNKSRGWEIKKDYWKKRKLCRLSLMNWNSKVNLKLQSKLVTLLLLVWIYFTILLVQKGPNRALLTWVQSRILSEVCVTHLFALFVYVQCFVCPILAVPLDCPFFISPSVFSDVFVLDEVIWIAIHRVRNSYLKCDEKSISSKLISDLPVPRRRQ